MASTSAAAAAVAAGDGMQLNASVSATMLGTTKSPHMVAERGNNKRSTVLKIVDDATRPATAIEAVSVGDIFGSPAMAQGISAELVAEAFEDEAMEVNSGELQEEGATINLGRMNVADLKHMHAKIAKALEMRGIESNGGEGGEGIEGTVTGKGAIDVLVYDEQEAKRRQQRLQTSEHAQSPKSSDQQQPTQRHTQQQQQPQQSTGPVDTSGTLAALTGAPREPVVTTGPVLSPQQPRDQTTTQSQEGHTQQPNQQHITHRTRSAQQAQGQITGPMVSHDRETDALTGATQVASDTSGKVEAPMTPQGGMRTTMYVCM